MTTPDPVALREALDYYEDGGAAPNDPYNELVTLLAAARWALNLIEGGDRHIFRSLGEGLQEGESSLGEYDRQAALRIIGLAIDGGSSEGVLAMLRSEGFDIYRADEKWRIGSHETGTGHFVGLWVEGSRSG